MFGTNSAVFFTNIKKKRIKNNRPRRNNIRTSKSVRTNNKTTNSKNLYHKSCHKGGLDFKIFKDCKKNKSKNYYFYIWDFCTSRTLIPNNFYEKNCNTNNTWNFNLKFNYTSKDSILKDTPKYGFGDYNINEYKKDEKYIVKAISHLHSMEKYGQPQLIDKKDINTVDTNKFIIQPVLKNNKGEELNIFVFKNLNTGEIYLNSIMVTHNTSKNINRKFNNCNYAFCDLNVVFGLSNINKFKNYCNSINFDYGRVEIINDINRGWCIIDVNNSPGGGPLTEMIKTWYINLFNKLI